MTHEKKTSVIGQLTSTDIFSHPAHIHPIFQQFAISRVCDVCSISISISSKTLTYRCFACDYDICSRCFEVEQKPISHRGMAMMFHESNGRQLFNLYDGAKHKDIRLNMTPAIKELIQSEYKSLKSNGLSSDEAMMVIKKNYQVENYTIDQD
jgi:hypothetical protein